MPEREYDINERVCLEIKMFDSKGNETMRVKYDTIDILRTTNLIQVFSSGRYDKDVRMTIDIAYPVDNEHQTLPKI